MCVYLPIIKQTMCYLIFQTWWVHLAHSNVIALYSLFLSVFSQGITEDTSGKMVFLKRNSLPATPLIRTHGTLPTFVACLFDKVIHLHGRVFRLHFARIFSISSQQSPLLFYHHTHTHTLTHTWNAPHSLLFLWAHSRYFLFLEHRSLLLLWKSPVNFSNLFTEGFSDLLDSLRA